MTRQRSGILALLLSGMQLLALVSCGTYRANYGEPTVVEASHETYQDYVVLELPFEKPQGVTWIGRDSLSLEIVELRIDGKRIRHHWFVGCTSEGEYEEVGEEPGTYTLLVGISEWYENKRKGYSIVSLVQKPWRVAFRQFYFKRPREVIEIQYIVPQFDGQDAGPYYAKFIL